MSPCLCLKVYNQTKAGWLAEPPPFPPTTSSPHIRHQLWHDSPTLRCSRSSTRTVLFKQQCTQPELEFPPVDVLTWHECECVCVFRIIHSWSVSQVCASVSSLCGGKQAAKTHIFTPPHSLPQLPLHSFCDPVLSCGFRVRASPCVCV